MADCDTGTLEWLSQPYAIMSKYIRDAFLRQEARKTHTIILLHLVYCLTSDKVQIDDEIHKENQHIRN